MKRKILFVDDEPNILEGLRRMLRGMRKEWTMSFAENGAEALELLACEPFDAVVSDMRMPGMDGAELLLKVRQRYPEIVRLILSGQSNEETILKSVVPVHQYLAKPCNSELLRDTLSRACTSLDIIHKPELKRMVAGAVSFPLMPGLLDELAALFSEPEPSASHAVDIVSRDIGMTVKLLQLVNSAFFGVFSHISGVKQAVELLGIETIGKVVSIPDVFHPFDDGLMKKFDLDGITGHCLNTGRIAGRIAAAMTEERQVVDNARIAGVLHDAGKMLFAAECTDLYERIPAMMEDEEMSFLGIERKTLGATHAEIGACLLGLWGFPDDVMIAVAYHHNPSDSGVDGLVPLAAVHIAEVLGNEDRLDANRRVQLDEEYLGSIGMSTNLSGWRTLCKETERESVSV